MNSRPKSIVLGRLRTAVDKVCFLLRHLASSSSWPLIPVLRPGQPLRLTLSDRRPSGLIDAVDHTSESESESYYEARSTASSVASSPVAAMVLHRTPSSLDSPVTGDVDIDRKAEDFIEKFHRQLKMEKQVSLELRYCRGQYSFGSNDSINDSPSFNLSLSSPSPTS